MHFCFSLSGGSWEQVFRDSSKCGEHMRNNIKMKIGCGPHTQHIQYLKYLITPKQTVVALTLTCGNNTRMTPTESQSPDFLPPHTSNPLRCEQMALVLCSCLCTFPAMVDGTLSQAVRKNKHLLL